jgi:hypothetical protein
MASRQNTPIDLDSTTSKALGTRSRSAALSRLSLPNTFGRIIAPNGPV